MNASAKLISILFHPLLLATYLFGLLSFTLPSALDPIQSNGYKSFILLIFLATFLLPVLNLFIFKLFGSLPSITMHTRQERVVPFTFIAILYGLVTYLFYARFRVGLSDNILKLMLIIDLLILIATLITIFYKLSVHSLAVWGFLGILIPLNKVSENGLLLVPTVVLLVIAGLVMSSRLQLQAHSIREIVVGSLVGYATSFVCMMILF